jgi:hypothetical protein
MVLQAAIRRARVQIDQTKAHFSDAFKKASGKSPTTGAFLEARDTVPFLIGAVLLGLLFTLAVLHEITRLKGGA